MAWCSVGRLTQRLRIKIPVRVGKTTSAKAICPQQRFFAARLRGLLNGTSGESFPENIGGKANQLHRIMLHLGWLT